MAWYSWNNSTLVLRLFVQPNAKVSQFIAPYGDDAFKLAIAAPPVEGKANKAVCRYLATIFEVAPSAVQQLKGNRSRYKQFAITNPAKLPTHITTRR